MRKVKKIWGEELWICNTNYCGKILKLKKGFRCSLHYHKLKDETFYIISGKVLMEAGKKKWTMKQGDVQHIKPRTLHRFTGITNAEIIEFSTHHLNSDSYRKELSGKIKCQLR
jgi:quercetin dioxygenase-like cupin family protein